MSAPRSETERPGDDFVIWPESPEREPRPLHEAIRPESWEALAPPEWVEPSAPAGSGEPVAVTPGTADVPQRFYPASRQWFRTTTPVASVEAGEKWWQMEPAVPVVREAGRSPGGAPPVDEARAASGFAEALAPSDVLSPEAIWEMAAAELEQASRLGAHPVTTAGPAEAGAAASEPALKTPEADVTASAEPEAQSPAAAAIAAAAAAASASFAPGVSGVADASEAISEDPGAAAVASGAGVTGSGGGALAAAAPAAEGSSGPGLAGEQAGRAPEPDLEKPVVAVDPRGLAVSEKALAAEVAEVGAPPVPVVPAPVASDEWLRIPPARVSGEGPKDPERAAPWPAAPMMAAPMMAAPGSAVPAAADDPLADFLAVETPPPAVRVEEEASPPRGARRPAGAGMARMPVKLAKKGHAFRSIPEVPAAAPGTGGEESVSVEEPVQRRRRERRSASPAPESPRGRWFRRGAVTAVLVLVAVAVTAVLTRDQWPAEWRREVRLWRRQAERLFWPEAHQSPQRGVLPRASDPSAAWPVPGSSVVDRAAQTPPPVAVPSRGDAAPATGTAETSGSGVPDVPRSVDAALTPAETPEAPSAPAAAAPEGSGSEVAPDGIPVRRAEPVPEDDAEAEEAGAAAAVPAGPVSDPAADPAADGGALNLWSGDDPSAAAAGPPPFEPTAGEATPPSSTDQAVAEGMEVVRRLVGARSADEVLPWIDGAGAQEAAVRSYYAKYPPRPMTDAVIEHAHTGTIPATGAHAHIFNVLSTTHPLGFPVSAEATPDGYRIDWPSFIQWRDRWLQRFVESPSDEPQELYVVLRRTHYFNDDVPDLENKLAFRLSSAIPEDEGVVAFVDKNSDLGQSLSEMYGWRVLYFPVVELQWVRTSREARHVRLNRVVRPTWRRAGE